MREEDKGATPFIIVYPPVLYLVQKNGHMRFLGMLHGALLHVII
jgi:hypothetical protein